MALNVSISLDDYRIRIMPLNDFYLNQRASQEHRIASKSIVIRVSKDDEMNTENAGLSFYSKKAEEQMVLKKRRKIIAIEINVKKD